MEGRQGGKAGAYAAPYIKGGFQMLINEGGLIRAIKRAYKAGGYTVLNTGNDVAIYTDHWFAMANRALLPRKVLASSRSTSSASAATSLPLRASHCSRRS